MSPTTLPLPRARTTFRPGLLGCLFVVLTAALPAQTPVVRDLRNTGPNANRLNVAVLGDGFTAAEQEQFFTVAQQKLDVLVNNEAFAPFKDVINGVAVFTASTESGTDIPGQSITRDTYYDTGFSSGVASRLLIVGTSAGSARAQTILRTHAPDYDIALLIVNTTNYGGAGGIPTVFSLNVQSDELMLHETGHAFAKLADEYIDEAIASSYPPAEYANATQKTARAEIPWRAFFLNATPIPTTATSTDTNFVGLWEGAHYRTTGFYRPIYDSKMRSLGRAFGPVNLRAFANAIHRANLNNATAPPSGVALQLISFRSAPGGTLALSVTAQGTGPLSYQWSQNGRSLAGQVQPTLTLTNVGASSAGSYNVEITNAAGVVSSAATGLTAEVVATGTSYEIQVGNQSVVQWAATSVSAGEQAGRAVLTLVRGGSSAGTFTVSYSTAPGTAGSPADFAAQTGTVTWFAGDSAAKTIAVPVVDDNLTEGIETFTVTLGAVSGGLLVGDATATVSLADPGLRDPGFRSDFINNAVYRIVPLPDGSLLVAGAFNAQQNTFGINYAFGGIARFSASGSLDTSFKPGSGANGTIRALVRQPDGKILIAGTFTSYNGTARNRVARLNTDGSLDLTFDPGSGAGGTVYDLLVQPDGKIVVAGAFITMNGTPSEYLARLDSNGSRDATFTGPDFGATTGWSVRSLAAQPDGKILVGGAFFFSGTTQRASLCRLNANGSLDTTFSGIVQGANTAFAGTSLGEVRSIALQPNGKFLIAGDITTYNQTARRGIARISADGSLDSTFTPGTGTDTAVETVSVQSDGKIVIGGAFTSFNGVPSSRLARLNTDGSLDTVFGAAGGSTAQIHTVVAQADGNLLIGSSVGSLQAATPNRPLWRVLAAAATTVLPPTITNVLVASGTQNSTFSFALTASNAPTSFSATNLPTGLSLDAATGVISGRPTVSGTINVTVSATNFAGTDTRSLALTIAPGVTSGAKPGRLINLSLLTSLVSADDNFTMGTVVGVVGGGAPNGTKPVLVRAAGPALGALGVAGTVDDPKLEFFAGSTKIGENDNWGGAAALSTVFAQVGAFAYAAANSKDAAFYHPGIPAGNYSIRVTGTAGATGTVIAELYDSNPTADFNSTTPRLINVSVLKQIGGGFTVGFVIGGDTSRSVLVRAVGPGLAGVGVTSGFLADPRLTLFAGSTQLNTNDDWGGGSALATASTQVGAFAIPANSRDAALLATLPPGQYSVQVAAPASSAGLVLVEVYEAP